jgi:hypothetical protein
MLAVCGRCLSIILFDLLAACHTIDWTSPLFETQMASVTPQSSSLSHALSGCSFSGSSAELSVFLNFNELHPDLLSLYLYFLLVTLKSISMLFPPIF